MENPKVVIFTSLGEMVFELYPETAPITVANFRGLVESRFYEANADHQSFFYRVIPGFVAQGGPTGDHGEQVGSTPIKGEFGPIAHERGVISMARPQDPDGASCQFFICLAKIERLDGEYASFGRLIAGESVLHEIERVERTVGQDGKQSSPVEAILIHRLEELVRD